jgi:hypothetical protein
MMAYDHFGDLFQLAKSYFSPEEISAPALPASA